MDPEIERLRGAFFEEASDYLAAMEAGLLAIEGGHAAPEIIHTVFRAAHSLKGAARTFGYDDLAGFAHVLEDLLDRLRSRRTEATPAITDLLLRANDTLRLLVAAAQCAGPPPPETATVLAALRASLGPPDAAAPAAPPSTAGRRLTITLQPDSRSLVESVDPTIPLATLSELGAVHRIVADMTRLPPLADLDPTRCYLIWTVELDTLHDPARVRDHFAFVDSPEHLSITSAPVTTPAREPAPPQGPSSLARPAGIDAASLRVATEKVDRLINLVGEVVIAQSMMAHILDGFTPDRLPHLHEALAEITRYTRELQERAMGIRMVPIATVFSRCPRVVRDLAATGGKQIALRTIGEDTELDKNVVDQLADPLMHLIRNAIDHGLEPTADRLAAGKPGQGTITLQAYHQSGKVVIEVQDDGRGLDTARIRAKAIANGLLTADEDASEDGIHAQIFEPGFSTAATVSAISGRGVGMDVVRRNVEALGGTVTISSRQGLGTCFRIRLPLTLAIIDGLSLRIGDQIFLLPLVAILESIRPAPADVYRVADRGELVSVRGEYVPLVRLHQLFAIPTPVTDPSQGLVVLVEHDGVRVALLVDELLGQQQVVVKSLEAHFGRVDGLGGATILGQGSVALILDVPGLLTLARTLAGAAPVPVPSLFRTGAPVPSATPEETTACV